MQQSAISWQVDNDNLIKLEFNSSETESIPKSKLKTGAWQLEIDQTLSITNQTQSITEILRVYSSRPDWSQDHSLVKKKKVIPDQDWSGFEHSVPKKAKIFALGEKTGQLDKSGLTYQLYNLDVGGTFPLNEDPLYLSIPFYLVIEPEQDLFYGVYLDYPGKSEFDFNYRTGNNRIGVSLNSSSFQVYLITGDSIEQILNQYIELTGKPFMPPKWALGYQHSKYGYPKNKEETLQLAEKFREEEFPCDVLYFDIQYMKDYKVFQWDQEKYGDYSQLIDQLHDKGFKVVTIIEPGVKAEAGFSVYKEGKEQDIFVKDKQGEICKGSVYPGFCAFPDFFKPEARQWWIEQHQEFLNSGIDGLWNDMNEPAIFFGKKQLEQLGEQILNQDQNGAGPDVDFLVKYKDLVHQPPQDWINFSQETETKQVIHEKVHNKYSYYEDKASYQAFKEFTPEKRPFILSRSGFAGMQQYATTWTGDNSSSWEDMRQSIPMLLNLGLSGLPLVGPDVGGFSGDVEPELLTRWIQLGTFYPFFRNHSMIKTAPQEPWVFGDEYSKINRNYIQLRYKILPHLYTLMDEAHRRGKPIIRPLFFEFPQDKDTYKIQDQFMVGNCLLVAPVLEKNKEKVDVYLPYEQGEEIKWKSWWSGKTLTSGHHLVEAPLEKIPLFIRPGTGLPTYQEKRKNTEEIPDKLTLKVNLNREGKAKVPIYFDDGHSQKFKEGEFFRGEYLIEGKNNSNSDLVINLNPEDQGYDLPWSEVEVNL